jgi:hypothetical protein
MKKYFLISLILFFSIFFEGCKKYEEGPLVSFRFRTTRISGKWRIESFTADGTDSMSCIYRYHLQGVWMLNDHISRPYFTITTDTYSYNGEYTTYDGHASIDFLVFSLQNNNIIINRGDWVLSRTWTIIKLKEKKMMWRTNYHGVEYVVYFKSI